MKLPDRSGKDDLETKKGWGEREAGEWEWEWGREGQGGESDTVGADDDDTVGASDAVDAVDAVGEEGRRRAGDDEHEQKEETWSGCRCDK